MDLRLPFAPTAENAPRHAMRCVEIVKEVNGTVLDYTPYSLHFLDEIIESFRQDGATSADVAETLFTFGCYVGEVFSHNGSWGWRAPEETSMRGLAGFPVIVELSGSDVVCNPIGKTFKRMENGIEDYLPYFYQVFTEEAQKS